MLKGHTTQAACIASHTTLIDKSDFIPATQSGLDEVGMVFLSKERVLRGIWSEHVEEMERLLA